MVTHTRFSYLRGAGVGNVRLLTVGTLMSPLTLSDESIRPLADLLDDLDPSTDVSLLKFGYGLLLTGDGDDLLLLVDAFRGSLEPLKWCSF